MRRLRNSELIILNELGYVLYTHHPHRFLLSYLQLVKGDAKLAQLAWNSINDAMRTCACVLFRPEALAAAAIWLGARQLAVPLPDSPPWNEVVDVTVDGMTIHSLWI